MINKGANLVKDDYKSGKVVKKSFDGPATSDVRKNSQGLTDPTPRGSV